MSMEDKFPDRLRRLRREKGVSGKVVGDFCGVSASAVCRYEKGDREPDMQTIIKLSEYFDVTTDYLLGKEK